MIKRATKMLRCSLRTVLTDNTYITFPTLHYAVQVCLSKGHVPLQVGGGDGGGEGAASTAVSANMPAMAVDDNSPEGEAERGQGARYQGNAVDTRDESDKEDDSVGGSAPRKLADFDDEIMQIMRKLCGDDPEDWTTRQEVMDLIAGQGSFWSRWQAAGFDKQQVVNKIHALRKRKMCAMGGTLEDGDEGEDSNEESETDARRKRKRDQFAGGAGGASGGDAARRGARARPSHRKDGANLPRRGGRTCSSHREPNLLHESTYEWYDEMAMTIETTPRTLHPQSQSLSAPGTAPTAVSVCSASRSFASTVFTMKSATVARIPGTYTILYLPEIGSQPPCGGGGGGVAGGGFAGSQG